jgi:hypothetical protein
MVGIAPPQHIAAAATPHPLETPLLLLDISNARHGSDTL